MGSTSRVRGLVLFLVGGCCVALSGCANPSRERLIGKWEASFEMSEDDMANMTPTDNPLVASFGKLLMKSLRADINWEFAADNTAIVSATFMGNTVTRRGTWRFLSGDETTTKVEVKFENDEPREVSFTFSDPDTFEAAPLANGKWQINRLVKFKRAVATP